MIKKVKFGIMTPALLAAGMSSQLQAADACINLEAEVAYVDDYNNVLGGRIPVGSVVTGSYKYNTDVSDNNGLPTVGDYWFNSGDYGITLQTAGFTFRSDPNNLNFLMEMIDNHYNRDNYLLRSYNNVFEGVSVSPDADTHIAWQLDDASAQAMSSTLLTDQPPVLANWQSSYGLTISSEDYYSYPRSSFMIRAHVTSATPCEDEHVQIINDLLSLIEELEATIAGLQGSLDLVNANYALLQDKYSGSLEEIQVLNTSYGALQDKYDALVQNYAELKAVIAKQSKEIASLEALNSELQQTNATLEQQYASLKKSYSSLKAQVLSLNAEIASLQSLNDGLQTANSALTEDNNQLSILNDTLTSSNANLTQALDEVNQSLDVANQQIVALTAQAQGLQDALDAANQQVADLSASNAALLATTQQQALDLSALEARIAALDAANQSLISENDALNAANQSLVNDNQTLTSENEALAAANEFYATQISNIDSATTTLESSLAAVFNDPTFSISGDPDAVIDTLITAILGLNNGQQQALYTNLGGKPGKKK